MEQQKQIGDRLGAIIEHYGDSVYGAAKKLGHDRPTKLYNFIGHKFKPGFDTLVEVLQTYPEVNPGWLMLGNGEMLTAAKAAEALETITQAVSVINDMNTQIASAAEEQSAVADDINRNVINIGQVANEVAGGADESSAASADLTKLAEQQRRLINQFKV